MIEWARSLVRLLLPEMERFRVRRVVMRGPDKIEIEADVNRMEPVKSIVVRIDPDPPYLPFDPAPPPRGLNEYLE